ncbi:MAG: UDP-N-acetylmuramoyl-L-alanyl-D-glutamate--2,6-diaminopimelate ligase [Rhodospirillaceae bacterium]|nr:MAG: UDP-N-acetylmuramoyl-L-alanyl-D-glutamate--2,6-diaminopimelate ligase [Rhodospirillaceae bacterium]
MQLIDLLKGDQNLIQALGENANLEISGLTCDSRAVRPGFVFAALPGVRVDGRDYITAALEKGAVCILAPLDTKTKAPLILDQNPRLRFAKMAANFYGSQPENIAAVTGTNGKTSVATFLRQIWERLEIKAVNIGTIGLFGAGFSEPGTLTTPDPVKLHETVKRVADAGVDHFAMEASSHGLEQYRLDGLHIKAAGFTNISRDHLDYHGTMDAYLSAKLRLFSEVVEDGGSVVVNADSSAAQDVMKIAEARGLKLISFGKNGKDICLVNRTVEPTGQRLSLNIKGNTYDVMLPLVGSFQVENALCALGLALALGADEGASVATLNTLEGVSGRLQYVGSINDAHVYIDYAHTPDALENVLKALRPHTQNKLHVVFGCGGNRDAGKRPLMGSVAAEFSDRAVVTDDNPRNENAAEIRKQVLATANDAVEIGDRHQAIFETVQNLHPGDVLVIAGKGHEKGQIIGDDVLPFDDVHEAKTALKEAVK